MQILLGLRAAFAYLLILLALAEKGELSNIIAPTGGAPGVFFRKSKILILLARIFVQGFDSK